MTRQEIGSLVSKIIGVYCFVQSALLFSAPLSMIVAQGFSGASGAAPLGYIGMTLFPTACLGFMGCFFFLASASVSGFFLPEHGRLPDPEEKDSPVSLRDFQAVAFSIIGLFVIIGSIRGLSSVFTTQMYVFLQMNIRFSGNPIPRAAISAIPWLFQLALGLWLFLRGTSLSNLWFRIRRAGVLAKEQTEYGEEGPVLAEDSSHNGD